jgi:DNA-binding MarR family transcriptional regulator
MKAIGDLIIEKEKTILLKGFDPVATEGFTQVPNLVLKNAKLSAGAKLVYSLLLSYAWHNDSAFPGQDRLAKDCGKTQSWVSKRMRDLESTGFLEIKRRGQGKTNIYILSYRVESKKQG